MLRTKIMCKCYIQSYIFNCLFKTLQNTPYVEYISLNSGGIEADITIKHGNMQRTKTFAIKRTEAG